MGLHTSYYFRNVKEITVKVEIQRFTYYNEEKETTVYVQAPELSSPFW